MSVVIGRTRDTLLLAAAMVLMTLTLGASSAWALPDYDEDGSSRRRTATTSTSRSTRLLTKAGPRVGGHELRSDRRRRREGDLCCTDRRRRSAGTLTSPKRNIATAITAAAAAGKDVFIAGGTYTESLQVVNNVSLYGGYEPITGKRTAAQETIIQGAPAVLAQGDTGVILQQLTIRGVPDGSGNSYGLRAVPSLVTSGTPVEDLPSERDGGGQRCCGWREPGRGR